jgi:16S rRNA processing protein RimM
VEPDAESTFVAIARIARTRGNRGEVLADLYTDFPDRFSALEEVWLEFADGRQVRAVIEDAWGYKGRIVLKFAGVDDISSAEAYAGCWVRVPAERAMKLPEGTYFDHDLVGCLVQDTHGNSLGVVKEVLRIAGNNQLVVQGPDCEYLVPAVDSICIRISVKGKQILIDPPEGLMDLSK